MRVTHQLSNQHCKAAVLYLLLDKNVNKLCLSTAFVIAVYLNQLITNIIVRILDKSINKLSVYLKVRIKLVFTVSSCVKTSFH